MKKLEEIQRNKLVSSYGASGSVIMTKCNGSLLINEYDRWPYYNQKKNTPQKINDNRLLSYIQSHYIQYKNVKDLVVMPDKDFSDDVYTANLKVKKQTISAQYFPKWFYCPHCRRLHKLDEWEQLWKNHFNQDDSFRKNVPACAFCSTQKGKKYHRSYLEQVRFVMASLDGGDLQEVPYERLIESKPDNKDIWNVNGVTPTQNELYYRTTSGGDGLQSVYVQEGQNGKRLHMSQLLRKYILIGSHAYKLLLRNNNNLFYPNILRNLYIPPVENKIANAVQALKNIGMPVNEIFNNLIGSHPSLTMDEVQLYYDDPSSACFVTDLDFDEFKYITDSSLYKYNSNRETDFWSVHYPNLKAKFVKHIYGLKQLKETSVLLSYSRVSPDCQKWYNPKKMETENMEPKQKLPFLDSKNITYLPGVESYGEGILFELDLSMIDSKQRFVFAHTYCHMIMKEMEFKCGYPVASLKEKIYFNENNPDSIGFLIYTIAGSEGSFGGVLALLPWNTNDSTAPIQDLIRMAFERVQHCNNDPICIHEDGHCFACLDLPETSCTEWNHQLDRRVIIDALAKLQNDTSANLVEEDFVLDE